MFQTHPLFLTQELGEKDMSRMTRFTRLAAFAGVAMIGAAAHAGIEGDDCESAIEIMPNTAYDFNTAVMNPSFVVGSDAQCTGTFLNWFSSQRDVWYTWTPDSDGSVLFTTCDTSSYDTSIIIYEGGCTTADQIACNGDSASDVGCQQFHASVNVDVTGGSTYYMRIGGYQGATGAGTFTAEVCEGNTVTVCNSGCDYTSIAIAVATAGCDTTIELGPGTYSVNSQISSGGNFTIRGQIDKDGNPTTILQGGNSRGFNNQGGNQGFENLIFQNFNSGGDGAAILNGGNAFIRNCIFRNNNSGAGGGAICFVGAQMSEITDTLFENNTAGYGGATFFPANGGFNQPVFTNCQWLNNYAAGPGGAVATGGSWAEFYGCVMEGNVGDLINSGSFGGGAMHFNAGGQPRVEDCVVVNNSANGSACGAAIWSGGDTVVTVVNSTLCNNDCSGNLNGYFGGNGTIVDGGGNDVSEECADPFCLGDINLDTVVNAADLGLLIGEWGCKGKCVADLNGDMMVNAADLGLLIGAWGQCAP
jgi:hypothetical protein